MDDSGRGALAYSPLKPEVERMWASDPARFGALLEVGGNSWYQRV
jgi:hypothetical protein